MKSYIKGISYYLPDNVVTNENLVEQFPEWSVDKIISKIGIAERHIAAVDETAGELKPQKNLSMSITLIDQLLIMLY